MTQDDDDEQPQAFRMEVIVKMPPTTLELQLPRYMEDINSRKRTLAHVPVKEGDENPKFRVGDRIRLADRQEAPRRCCMVGTITAAERVRLHDVTDADLGAINVPSLDEYVARWDAVNPTIPFASNPEVWRIAWGYDSFVEFTSDPSEWSLAT